MSSSTQNEAEKPAVEPHDIAYENEEANDELLASHPDMRMADELSNKKISETIAAISTGSARMKGEHSLPLSFSAPKFGSLPTLPSAPATTTLATLPASELLAMRKELNSLAQQVAKLEKDREEDRKIIMAMKAGVRDVIDKCEAFISDANETFNDNFQAHVRTTKEALDENLKVYAEVPQIIEKCRYATARCLAAIPEEKRKEISKVVLTDSEKKVVKRISSASKSPKGKLPKYLR